MTLAEAKEKGLTELVKILEQDRDRREVLGMPKLEAAASLCVNMSIEDAIFNGLATKESEK